MDAGATDPQPVDLSEAYFQRFGIGAWQGRQVRLDIRRGFIDLARLAKAEALERKTGRRAPHW